MKFVHIADLHLGKALHQYSLLPLQRELLFELLEYTKQENISVLVIAGDIYDRFIPSQEAVNLLDEFLSKALLEHHMKVFMISGNHDSSDRLHFGSNILKQEGLYIETHIKDKISVIELEDEYGSIFFHLLPFVKPSAMKQCDLDTPIDSYQDAFSYYMEKQKIDTNTRNIMVTHQFVGGTSNITSESEVPLSVGGSEIIDASLFDQYDYVALGHLHAPQKIKRETMRYSGSLMRYSFDEVTQDKTFVVVDIKEKGNITLSYPSLHPSLEIKKEEGYFNDFLKVDYLLKKNDLYAFDLLDHQIIPHAIDSLRSLYPNLLQIRYPFFLKETNTASKSRTHILEQKTLPELFSIFYQETKGETLDEDSQKQIEMLFEKAGEE